LLHEHDAEGTGRNQIRHLDVALANAESFGQHLLMQHEGIVHHQKEGEHARREEETPERTGIVVPNDGIGEE
jgi:hypothetical protein